jgi:hypothetical protein
MAEPRHHPQESPRISLRRQQGQGTEASGFIVTPEALVLALRLPCGAFVWQRPSAVVVAQGAQSTRLSIHDATRLAQCALIVGGILVGLLARGGRGQSKEVRP